MLKVAEEIVIEVIKKVDEDKITIVVDKGIKDPLPLLRMLSSTFWAVGNKTCIENLIEVTEVTIKFQGPGTWILKPETSSIILEADIDEPEVVSNVLNYAFTINNPPLLTFSMAFDKNENTHNRKIQDYERYIELLKRKGYAC